MATNPSIARSSASPARRLRVSRGLYAITDRTLCARHGFAAAVEAALRGGAVMVQYRDKSGDEARRLEEATVMTTLCSRHGALSIVNDDVELARTVGADGVHVGREDEAVREARARLGPDAVVGASCYDSFARARDAVRDGASYVAFGSFFASPTKPHAVPADLSLIVEARSRLGVPVTAIGGITAANAGALVEAGVDHIAVISALFGAEDVQAAAGALSALFGPAG